jgi:hypothetical protein
MASLGQLVRSDEKDYWFSVRQKREKALIGWKGFVPVIPICTNEQNGQFYDREVRCTQTYWSRQAQ